MASKQRLHFAKRDKKQLNPITGQAYYCCNLRCIRNGRIFFCYVVSATELDLLDGHTHTRHKETFHFYVEHQKQLIVTLYGIDRTWFEFNRQIRQFQRDVSSIRLSLDSMFVMHNIFIFQIKNGIFQRYST